MEIQDEAHDAAGRYDLLREADATAYTDAPFNPPPPLASAPDAETEGTP
jgi:hypothetical protein